MKLETNYTPEEIIQIATRPFVISSLFGNVDGLPINDNFVQTYQSDRPYYWGNHAFAQSSRYQHLDCYENDGNRKIGLITGIMDDGSFILSILGNGVIKRSNKRFIHTGQYVNVVVPVTKHPILEEYSVDASGHVTNWGESQDAYDTTNNNNTMLSGIYVDSNLNYIPLTAYESAMYEPVWQAPTRVGCSFEAFLHKYAKTGNVEVADNYGDIQLTDSKNTTLTIGDAFYEYDYYLPSSDYIKNGYKNVGGAVYDSLSDVASSLLAFLMPLQWSIFPPVMQIPISSPTTGTYACHYIPFNLILTRNESEAIDYLNTGVLPSDAFIYPYDVDNIPTNTSGTDEGTDPTDADNTDVPNEDGTPADNADDMPTEPPEYSPQSLTNNNLYWLSALGLQQFIDWFWTDATDIASVGDLWDKITGLYENLSQSVLSIRYMPVKPAWVGGLGSDTKIIVGMIEKEHNVSTINKTVSNVQHIGFQKISTLFNGSWCNYSPYSTISLYLPFHGMVQLDNDLLMNHSIYVSAVYDILSGTIQYFVHRDSYSGALVYSTVAKMSVDIPITLQTKTERDSAVFSNVANMTAGIIGAGASAVAGSPVGMTMGLANLASVQPASAGLHVLGNVGESGAFYAPRKCALYIKRPAYNRPSNYKERVGFPANTTRKLQSCSGFTTCYNPRITFAGNTHTENGDTVTIKPTKSEVEKIYDYLEKGVII